MAHWDEERDRRWVRMMRECKQAAEPEMKALIDQFEANGDTIYWRQFFHELRKRLGDKQEKASSAG